MFTDPGRAFPFPSGSREEEEPVFKRFTHTLLRAFPTARRSLRGQFLSLVLVPIGISPALAQDTQTPCSSEAARAFDFWVGDWEVQQPAGTPVGTNSIRKVLNGCVLHESYQTPGGYAGESFNIFDASRQLWHQTWVDIGGLLLILEGGFVDGAMILKGETHGPDGPVKQRITWRVVDGDPDRVNQLWESSTDGGREWTVAFDGLYVRKPQSGGPL